MSEILLVIYSVANIKDALSIMSLNQSKNLSLYLVIYVRVSVWKARLLKINKQCGTKWTKLRKWKGNNKLIFGEIRQCHRNGAYESKSSIRIGQKEGKRCKCAAQLNIARYHGNVSGHSESNVVEFKLLKDCTKHAPGNKRIEHVNY